MSVFCLFESPDNPDSSQQGPIYVNPERVTSIQKGFRKDEVLIRFDKDNYVHVVGTLESVARGLTP